MGKLDATEDEMIEALKMAAAYDFVMELPNGIDTVIGERGHGISEGQAQRIAIARALIKKAPFLILDEATSSLDPATELLTLYAENVYVAEVYDNSGKKVTEKDGIATSFTVWVTPDEVENLNLAVVYGGVQMYLKTE